LVVVALESVVAHAGILLNDEKLHAPLPAHVPVERIIVGAGDDDMLHVDSAAEYLNTVIKATVHLYVAHDGAVAAAAKRQPVEFVIAGNFVAGELDAGVFKQAATAGRIVTAERATAVIFRNAFNARIGEIDRCAAE